MITVIIPAFNEAATISAVVNFCFSEKLVSEVIVVDDKSNDDTASIAAAAGAVVITSQTRGKGISMRDGIQHARNEILVFLDADIDPYPENAISKLAYPLIHDECDFVKGAFVRNAGRVTELVAKPLIKIFFPELAGFSQPLSGMIAGKKTYLARVDFYKDYGVDVGILIDMFMMQARMQEVNIGYIENKSKPWQLLGKMSGEVSRAIIQKASARQPNIVNTEELATVKIITAEMKETLHHELDGIKKLVVFDMDHTLLRGSYIDTLAEQFSFSGELNKLRSEESDAAALTKKIARLLKGLGLGDLLRAIAAVPVVEDAALVIRELKRKGNIVGIISDSYQTITDYVKNKINADFSIGNRLEFAEGKATGEVIIPSWFYAHDTPLCSHAICKTNVLLHIARRFNISMSNCITVGDGYNDTCMLRHAGMGVAFCTAKQPVREAADMVIETPSFMPLLHHYPCLIKKKAAFGQL
ncbi:MAG: HAD-IB family phosphatase [Ferruginibacter sp.]